VPNADRGVDRQEDGGNVKENAEHARPLIGPHPPLAQEEHAERGADQDAGEEDEDPLPPPRPSLSVHARSIARPRIDRMRFDAETSVHGHLA
jgi:hypothetical protein